MNETMKNISILTLGCRVNQYESDYFAAKMKEAGYRVVPFGQPCNLSLVNTCTVTAESDRKSRQMIRRAAQYAEKVMVAGCYSQMDAQTVAAMDKVVYVCGNNGKAALAETALSLLNGTYAGPVNAVFPPEDRKSVEMAVPFPMRTRSYVKIEDGCHNRCSYCIISSARGPVRSKDPKLVLDEIRCLAKQGCREVILTGIETASYGMDFSARKPYGHDLADLIEEVAKIEGIERIGLGSLDPTVMSPYFCEIAKRTKKLLPHFHLSMQSGSDKILHKMRRKYTAAMILAGVERMKTAVPNVTFSADIIVGFPDETEEDFLATLSLCQQISFLHLHIFPYSKRQGTEAAVMDGQVKENVKKQRAALLEEEGKRIKLSLLNDYVSTHRDTPVYLLVEKCIGGFCSGHSEHFVEIKKVPREAPVGSVIPALLENTDGEVCLGRPL